MQKLFSYGTLQQENVQQSTFGRPLQGVSDTLVGYRLDSIRITDADVIAKSGKEFHPILVHTGDHNDVVEGTIFDVTNDELALADDYEVDDYVRVSAQFQSGTTAWIYADARQNQHDKKTTRMLEAFTEVVESRRSVRRFTETPISDEVLRECFRLAMLAPNSSNLQPWEFYVIDDANKRTQANKICMNQNAAKTANKLIAVVARTDTWQENAKQILEQYPDKPIPKSVQTYYGKLIPIVFTRGPANAASLAKRGIIKAHRTLKGPIKTPIYNQHQLKTWAVSNTFLAAENLMLALRAHGFDSCPMGGFDEPAMKKLLGLHADQHIAMMIGAGERADNGIYNEQFRFDYDQFVKHV